MITTDIIRLKIDKFSKGYVFTYKDFISDVNQKEAIIKCLNRMASSGRIIKLSKGKYYKPQSTPFGDLQPEPYQIVKDILEKNNKTVGYLTGYSIYNQLRLSTQVSNTIQIGKNDIRPTFKRGVYTISFIKQKNIITKENIPLLQILDAIRYIKKIPDSTVSQACKQLQSILKKLGQSDVKTMMRLSLKYPPATRALLGAMLTQIKLPMDTSSLFNSLNPITVYKIDIAETILPNKQSWNIQ
ncbi:MAG: hypothetical protein H8E70_10505 [Candidatus Marinimicrobia bacterium]|nr:hypothetical protein [Candidatus Neomarinimicrobiota bacterium]